MKAIEKIKGYLHHKNDCNLMAKGQGFEKICDYGLDELLAEAEQPAVCGECKFWLPNGHCSKFDDANDKGNDVDKLDAACIHGERPAEAKAIDYQQPDNKTYPSIEQPAALKSKNFIVCCECLDMAKRKVEKLK